MYNTLHAVYVYTMYNKTKDTVHFKLNTFKKLFDQYIFCIYFDYFKCDFLCFKYVTGNR